MARSRRVCSSPKAKPQQPWNRLRKSGKSLPNFWLYNEGFPPLNSLRTRQRLPYRACKTIRKERPSISCWPLFTPPLTKAPFQTASGNLFQTDFSAWQRAPNAAAGAQCESGSLQSASLRLRCADSLQTRKHLTDSERLLLGKTHFTLQQYEPAADALAQVPGVTNENAEASYWLSRTYQALGAEAYSRLEESFPDSWRAHQLRAEGYALRQDLDGAVKEFHVALQLRPNEPELHEALGELYLVNHSDDDAQSELEKALALDPSRPHALYLLGRFYVQTRENEKALSYLQRALRLQPDLDEASGLLGTAYVRLGQFANAIPKLEKAAPETITVTSIISCIWPIENSAKPSSRRKRWLARRISAEALLSTTRP